MIGGFSRQSYTLRDIRNYAELKHDPGASLPSSFTICVSVLVTTENLDPFLFSLTRNDGRQWFSAAVRQLGNFVGKKFFYEGANQYAHLDTVPIFPNEWVRSCLALNTVSGLVQWVARGELVDNSTFAVIAESKDIPKDLTGKLILGASFNTVAQKWNQKVNKVTNLNIFSSALSVEKMQEYTEAENGCGEDGDYLSWDEMQWKLHGDAKLEHLDIVEACAVQSWSLYPTGFPEMDSCMHFCENLGGTRVPPVTTLLQWKKISSFLARKKGRTAFWLPIDDIQNEEEWRDFYNHDVLNYTLPWAKSEPNGGTSENCAVASYQDGGWFDWGCSSNYPSCLCERDPSFHLELRGLCAKSAIDKYFRPMNNFSDSVTLQFVGLEVSTIEYDKKNKNWKLSPAGSDVSAVTYAAYHTFLLGKHEWVIIGDQGCTVKNEENIRTQCKIEFTYASHCVSKNLTPRRMLKNSFLIAQIICLNNSFQNMYEML